MKGLPVCNGQQIGNQKLLLRFFPYLLGVSAQISRKIIKYAYPIHSLERQPVILELTASVAFRKRKSKQDLILSNSTFYNLSTDI